MDMKIASRYLLLRLEELRKEMIQCSLMNKDICQYSKVLRGH